MPVKASNGTCRVLDDEIRGRLSDALVKQRAAAEHVLRVIEQDRGRRVDSGTRVPYGGDR